jgi:hypothetical protein
MHDYLLTIRLPFKAMDDPASRQEAQAMLRLSLQELLSRPDTVQKLQRLELSGPPVKVDLTVGNS